MMTTFHNDNDNDNDVLCNGILYKNNIVILSTKDDSALT